MNHLAGKKIILGVCGSIAAYKSVSLARWLIKQGAELRVVMTASACDFITPLTFSTLSKHPVTIDVSGESGWNNHVELGLWADILVIAPVTATSLAKLSLGICDNMLTATYLSARCPVWVVPAMDLDMWKHPATQRNINQLKNDGVNLIPPVVGELASGLVGEGRFPEPEEIGKIILSALSLPDAFWMDKKVLITAGPTYEAIDPVRFIGNRSSGKMGISLAENLANKGAQVTLVLGPTQLDVHGSEIQLIRVESAEEMFKAANQYFKSSNVTILAAAVADFKPANYAVSKIKKASASMNIALTNTPDIAATLGKNKSEDQILVGFALETDHEIENAMKKLVAKNLDLIVLNSLKHEGAGFQYDTNKITIITKNNIRQDFELKSKVDVAEDIVNAIKAYSN